MSTTSKKQPPSPMIRPIPMMVSGDDDGAAWTAKSVLARPIVAA